MDETQSVVAEFRAVAETPEDVAEPLRRLTDPDYADGISAPRATDADPQAVAFLTFDQDNQSIENAFDLSALWIFWGQFLDHDLSLTPEQEGPEAELLKFDPPFNVVRSEFVEGTGVTTPREQPNVITPLVDASNVYGSDRALETALRTLEGGRLKTQDGPDIDLLPDATDVFGLDYEETEGFTAGDVRARENPGLAAIHTVWVNEHNYWADRLAAEHPDWTDEALFQSARAIVETLIQKISYEEFLPVLLGDAMDPYEGYDPSVDPQVTTEFSTAAYRFGHTSIPNAFTDVAEDGTEGVPLPLFDTFENDDVLLEGGAGNLLRGLLEERSQAIDTKVVESLNFFLFTEDGGLTGFSLPERNLLRGHDHGIPPYLEVREEVLGDVDASALAASRDFSVITSDPQIQADLAQVYDTLGDVDLWVGGLAEDYAPGVTLGPLFQAIQAEQFAAVRDADPLFYLGREWTDEGLRAEVFETQFSDVLMRSGGVDHVQREALLASDRMGGDEGKNYLVGAAGRELLIGFDGKDVLVGLAGDDDLFGDAAKDYLIGGEGSDGLSGGAGHDKLKGGAGPDIIAGGDGADYLSGGAGPDRFEFTAGEEGVDTIQDFAVGVDLIVLHGFGAAYADLVIETGPFMAEIFVGEVEIATVWGMAVDGLPEESFLFVN